MGDERLRELERRWKESGIIKDRVAYIRERMRSGMIVVEHVMGAAMLGHSAAMGAVEFRPPMLSQERRIAAVVKDTKISPTVVFSWLLEDVTAPLETTDLEIGTGVAILSLARTMREDLRRVVVGRLPVDSRFEQSVVGVPLVSRLDACLFDVAQGLSNIVQNRADRLVAASAVLLVDRAMEQLLRGAGLPSTDTADRLAERLLA